MRHKRARKGKKMNKHEEARKNVVEMESYRWEDIHDYGIKNPKCKDDLLAYITQSEATEKELEGLKEIIAELRREGVVK